MFLRAGFGNGGTAQLPAAVQKFEVLFQAFAAFNDNFRHDGAAETFRFRRKRIGPGRHVVNRVMPGHIRLRFQVQRSG